MRRTQATTVHKRNKTRTATWDACASQPGARARAGGARSGVDGLLLVDLLNVRLHGVLLGHACGFPTHFIVSTLIPQQSVYPPLQTSDAPFLSAQALHLALPVRSNMPGLAVSLSPTVACLYSAYSASFSSFVCKTTTTKGARQMLCPGFPPQPIGARTLGLVKALAVAAAASNWAWRSDIVMVSKEEEEEKSLS